MEDVSDTVPPPSPKAKPRRGDDGGAGIKETLESILVAFVLAFIFRCFIVEAFVIPTGSMAPTLLGAHTRHTCPECGYAFAVDYHPPGQDDSDDVEIPPFAGPYVDKYGRVSDYTYTGIRCPNCGYRLPSDKNPPVAYGDRILVLKYAYLLGKPKRWDVVVFKTPVGRTHRYEQNYIKRLIGLPGETIMVLDGDIYVKPLGGSDFVVQQKTPEAQDAMWRVIYEDDYRPMNAAARTDKWIQPWQQVIGTGWRDGLAHPGRGFAFEGQAGHGTLRFNPSAGPRDNNVDFKDWLAYDQSHFRSEDHRYDPRFYEGKPTVADLKLDFYYERKAGAGPLKLAMSKLNDRFVVELLSDRAILHHESKGQQIGERSAALPSLADGAHHVELCNADYCVTLKIDGLGVLQTTPAEYQPDVADLIARQKALNLGNDVLTYRGDGSGEIQRGEPFPQPVVQIEAERQTSELTHVALWRDVYYTQELAGGGASITWGQPVQIPTHEAGPVHLNAGEYFVMGDNSPLSYDARFWNEPIDLPGEKLKADGGRVPERFMLGRAFFVYWPAGFKPTEKMPGVVPNFGEMRFIR